MQAIKYMLAGIIVLLGVIALELAKILSSLNAANPSPTVYDFGIPIMIMISVGTLVILMNANFRSRSTKQE